MAGIFGFLSSFGKEQLGQVGQSLMQKIVSWDPETATQAEIEEMIKDLDKITKEVGKAKTEYDKENAEALAIQKNYDRFVAAAEILDKQLQEAAVAGNSAKERELGSSLEKLLKELETMQPEVEREAKEAEDARVFYEELHAMATQTADKVKTARDQLTAAKRDMQKAEMQQKMAAERAKRAEHLSGLRKDTGSLGVALEAMNRQAIEARSKAEASTLKAKLLHTEAAPKDNNIEAALRLASGKPDVQALPSAENFRSRLEALKKKD